MTAAGIQARPAGALVDRALEYLGLGRPVSSSAYWWSTAIFSPGVKSSGSAWRSSKVLLTLRSFFFEFFWRATWMKSMMSPPWKSIRPVA